MPDSEMSAMLEELEAGQEIHRNHARIIREALTAARQQGIEEAAKMLTNADMSLVDAMGETAERMCVVNWEDSVARNLLDVVARSLSHKKDETR